MQDKEILNLLSMIDLSIIFFIEIRKIKFKKKYLSKKYHPKKKYKF